MIGAPRAGRSGSSSAGSLSLNGTVPTAPVPVAGVAMFLVAGAILGSGLGGVQVADRVFMIRLSPPERLGEFFGCTGWSGKASQVIGQLLFGVIMLPAARLARRRRLPDRDPEPARDDAHRAWLVWPVSDRWTGSGEVASRPPPERLAPGRRAARASAPAGSVAVAVRVRRRQAQAEPIISSRVDRARRQPGPRAARALDATRTGGSPARRGPTACGIGRPTTRAAASSTSRTQNPSTVPRLQTSGRRPSAPPSAVARRGRLERAQVRVGEVRDVDVVADRRAVGRRVVVAEQRQRGPALGRRRARSG